MERKIKYNWFQLNSSLKQDNQNTHTNLGREAALKEWRPGQEKKWYSDAIGLPGQITFGTESGSEPTS